MELRQYWNLLRKWLWLIIIATAGLAALGYLFSSRQTPIYEASSRLRVIQGSSSNPTVTYADVLMSERLSSTYAQMLEARPVLSATIERLGLVDQDVEKLALAVSVVPVRDTQLIDLKVEHPSPVVAAAVANTLPQVFIAYNNEQQSERYQESKQALQAELSQLDSDIRQAEQSLVALSAEDATGQRVLLENRLTQYRSSYGNVLSQLENIRLAEANALNTISITEPAVEPKLPIRPRPLVNTLLAAVIGGLLGLSVIFLVEYLDDTLKSPDEISRLSGLSTLGVIARQRDVERTNDLITVTSPRSPVTEAYRTVRTAIQFSGIDKPIRTLVVTSAGPAEGKSTTAANLAVVMAQTGKRTVLIDADLRKPTQHKRWKLPNTVGLTGALLFAGEDDDLEYLLLDTSIENLKLMTSGQLPPNPSELLGSHKLRALTERLLRNHDILIFDSPPALAVTDPAVLGQAMDGVLLVVSAGTTREMALMQTQREMEKVNAHLLGVVVNRFQAGKESSYYYYYYDRYYTDEEEGERSGTGSGDGQHRSQRRKKSSRHTASGIGQRLLRSVRRS